MATTERTKASAIARRLERRGAMQAFEMTALAAEVRATKAAGDPLIKFAKAIRTYAKKCKLWG